MKVVVDTSVWSLPYRRSRDFLICAAAVRRGCTILTTESDFKRFAPVLPIKLHQLRE